MMTWKRYGKKDANHDEVAAVFKNQGYTILDIHRVEKSCDFIASNGKRVLFIEVKSKHGRIRDTQRTFAASWPEPVYVLRDAAQAYALLMALENHRALNDFML